MARNPASGIEYRVSLDDEIYASMESDDVIELPGKCRGKDTVFRATVGTGGRLREVKEPLKADSNPRCSAWDIKEEIIQMYVGAGLTLREIGEKIGFSRQTVCNILQEAGVRAAQKGKKPQRERTTENDGAILRLYVDEDRPVREISKLLNLSVNAVSESLREHGVMIKRGGMRTIVFPELRNLNIGESLELPRVISNSKQTYVRYYEMAKSAGIKVSVRSIGEEKVRVTRKG